MRLCKSLAKQRKEKKFKLPSEAERLERYFWELERIMPNPPRDWAKSAKPCKYLKLLEERKQNNGEEGI
jgi:predicted secreted protein